MNRLAIGLILVIVFSSFSVGNDSISDDNYDIRPPFRLSAPTPEAQYFTNEGFRASFVGSKRIARDLFYKACLLGDDLGCLAFNEIKAPLKIKDNFISHEACNLGDSHACFKLYEYYLHENIPDNFSATWYLSKACRLGNTLACKVEISKIRPLISSKRQILNNKCFLKDANSCFALANIYLLGDGVQKNFSFAKELIAKSCNLGFKKACIEYIKILSIN